MFDLAPQVKENISWSIGILPFRKDFRINPNQHPPSPFGKSIGSPNHQPKSMVMRMVERKQTSNTWKGRIYEDILCLGNDLYINIFKLVNIHWKKSKQRWIIISSSFAILTGHSDLELQYVSPVAMPPPEVVKLCQRPRGLRGTIANGLLWFVYVCCEVSCQTKLKQSTDILKIASVRRSEEFPIFEAVFMDF